MGFLNVILFALLSGSIALAGPGEQYQQRAGNQNQTAASANLTGSLPKIQAAEDLQTALAYLIHLQTQIAEPDALSDSDREVLSQGLNTVLLRASDETSRWGERFQLVKEVRTLGKKLKLDLEAPLSRAHRLLAERAEREAQFAELATEVWKTQGPLRKINLRFVSDSLESHRELSRLEFTQRLSASLQEAEELSHQPDYRGFKKGRADFSEAFIEPLWIDEKLEVLEYLATTHPSDPDYQREFQTVVAQKRKQLLHPISKRALDIRANQVARVQNWNKFQKTRPLKNLVQTAVPVAVGAMTYWASGSPLITGLAYGATELYSMTISYPDDPESAPLKVADAAFRLAQQPVLAARGAYLTLRQGCAEAMQRLNSPETR